MGSDEAQDMSMQKIARKTVKKNVKILLAFVNRLRISFLILPILNSSPKIVLLMLQKLLTQNNIFYRNTAVEKSSSLPQSSQSYY
jgi:hypothetical protein